MTVPLKINGSGNPISAAMGHYVTAKIKAMDEPGMRLFMHPLQFCRVCNIPNFIVLVDSVEKATPSKFCGLEIVEDEHMQNDEIHWRDKDGVIVAKITGLKV